MKKTKSGNIIKNTCIVQIKLKYINVLRFVKYFPMNFSN